MNEKTRNRVWNWSLIGLFGVAALALPAGGYWLYRHQTQAIQSEKQSELKAIADLKAQAASQGRTASDEEISNLQRSFGDRIPRPPLSQLIDQIDHIAKVAGIDHVGLGSDFDGINGQLPEGINSAAALPKITEALMARGYSAEECRKILGGNLLRVFREVEQVARTLQAENRPRISEKQPFDKVQK